MLFFSCSHSNAVEWSRITDSDSDESVFVLEELCFRKFGGCSLGFDYSIGSCYWVWIVVVSGNLSLIL